MTLQTFQFLVFFFGLSIAHSHAADTNSPISAAHASAPKYSFSTFTAQEFWSKILLLLNEDHGTVTKSRFEEILGVKLGPPFHASDETTYWYHGEPGYLEARLTLVHKNFKSSSGPELNGAHQNWYVGWKPDSFGGSSKGECITADHVRTSLISSGWTSPWPRWGMMEESRRTPTGDPGLSWPKPSMNFARQSDAPGNPLDRLPRGTINATDDLPTSCISGIVVTAKPHGSAAD